jgi:CTP:molybdopterin cytidylyltransferase MocA
MIPAVVLAAGLSSRMGRSKALVPISDRETFLSRVVRTFLEGGADDIVIVIGHEGEAVAGHVAAAALPARLVFNAAYENGQFSSVLAGLQAVDRPGVRGLLLTPVDVPLVAASTVRAVIDRYRASSAPIVRPVRGDEHGHPVLIDRALFAPLRAANPAHGAKPIVRAHASPAGDVAVTDTGAFLDIDTPEDYMRVFGVPLPTE